MALATRRSYAGAAPACTLSSDIAAGATSFSITGTTTNWPTTATGPFYMVIDPGLSTEEKVLVAGRTGGSLSSVTRGVDGTTAASHVTGATCYPVFTAVDANDANLLASRLSAKGDLISSDGSDPTKVAVGANNTRLVADSAQTSGIKWVADTQNTVIDAKGDLLVGSAADTVARLAVGTDGHVVVADSTATNGLSYSPRSAGFRNGIINGSFDVWQRANSATFTPTVNVARYDTADRWAIVNGNVVSSITTARVAADNSFLNYGMQWGRTAGQTNTGPLVLAYNMESLDARKYAGKQVTISFWLKRGTGTSPTTLSFQAFTGTGTDQSTTLWWTTGWTGQVKTVDVNISPTTTMTRYQYTFTPASTTNQIIFVWFYTPSGTASGEFIQIEGVQFEEGAVASPFERRPFGTELALCQRYYERASGGAGSGIMPGFFITADLTSTAYRYIVPKRSSPTFTVSNFSNLRVIYGGGGVANITGLNGATISADAIYFQFSHANFATIGQGNVVQFQANGWIEFGAEL